jgi:hypothetical protein
MGNAQNKPKDKKSKKEKSERKSKQTASVEVAEDKTPERPTSQYFVHFELIETVKGTISADTVINVDVEDKKQKSTNPNEYSLFNSVANIVGTL